MRIAISSKSGCGNTTVTTMLSKRLGYPMVNFTFRQMAEERGVDFWTFCRMAENDYDIDRELDRRQVEMAMKEEDCILASRLAVWMLKEADLIEDTRDGKYIYYELNASVLEEILLWISDLKGEDTHE